MLGLAIVPGAYAEVGLYGELVIQESYVGCKYLGEIVNDTSSPVVFVEVVIAAKNSSGDVLDTTYSYVDGYTDPVLGTDTYIPPGEVVPFYMFGDAEPQEIASTEVTINYETSENEYSCPLEITELYQQQGYFGDDFFGYIVNNSDVCQQFVSIVFAFKDATGRIVQVDYSYIFGSDYMIYGWLLTDTVIPSGGSAPFRLLTFIEPDKYESYYTIINYEEGDAVYDYYGSDSVVIEGNITKTESFGACKYLGDVFNGSDTDIYFVRVTIVTRNTSGGIIDISYDNVNGTTYAYSEDTTTDTHIAPNASAPFEILTSVDFDDAASMTPYINYHYAEPSIAVDEQPVRSFQLLGNYPNPFNPITTIEFEIPDYQPVRFCVFSLTGQLLDEIVNDHLAPGIHTVIWDGSRYSSGTYLYRITSGNHTLTGRMMLIK